MSHVSTKLKPKAKPKTRLLPIWFALAGIALVIIAGWVIMTSNTDARANVSVKGAARLMVKTETIDHGDVKLGVPIRDDVRITNIGDQPLSFAQAPYVVIKEGC